jgi:transcriptional regulator with XRE-family HTH domain
MFMGTMAHDNPVLAFRLAKKWTRKQFVEELERKTGVSISTTMLGHVERGYRYFGGKVAVAVEKAFKIKVSAQRAVEISTEDRAA